MNKLAVVAIGGNSLIEDPQKMDIPSQRAAVVKTATRITDMIEEGWQVVVTHGNGPQAGFALRRSELAAEHVHPLPLDAIVATTQGSIGFMLQQALNNELRSRGLAYPVATLVTQTQVHAADPAFNDPSKPIGGYLTEEQAAQFRDEGWHVVDDAGRGLRRVVPSPRPYAIVEQDVIESMLKQGIVVIAAGGGGIPVVDDGGCLKGAAAVVDKDLTASLLACALQAELFLISTAVEQVAIHFKTPRQQWLDRMTLQEARAYLAEGHFSRGSMAPKVEAVIQFIEAGGPRAIITNPANILRAITGQAGTTITRQPEGLHASKPQ
jgi:carbamate kinase